MIKSYSKFRKKQSENDIREYVVEKYKKMADIDYSDSIEVSYDEGTDTFIAWVKPYSEGQLYSGKTGLSESDAKKRLIVAAKSLRDDDPAGWIPHEIGHIIGHDKGCDNKKGSIIPPQEVNGLRGYPNVWSEFFPFVRQIRFLMETYGRKKGKIVSLIMKDYVQSDAHKGNEKEIEQIRSFVSKMYDIARTEGYDYCHEENRKTK